MLYELNEWGNPQPIRQAEIDGILYTNPNDELLTSAGIGYRLEKTDPPTLEEHQRVNGCSWQIVDGAIRQVWNVIDKTPEELKIEYQNRINQIYADAEEFKKNGKILYPGTGKEYIPRWAYEFYNTIFITQEIMFPTPESRLAVAAVDGTYDNLTLAEFTALFQFIINAFSEYTADQNAEIAELNRKIKALDSSNQEEQNN